MKLRTTVKKHSKPNFELRSVLLFSALAAGVLMTTQAQTQTNPQPPTVSAASSQLLAVGVVDAIPSNKTTNREVDEAFNRADANADGRLSREEARHFPAIEPRFDQIDSNHDNFISRDEFMKAAGSGS